jgi:hypothetical protein
MPHLEPPPTAPADAYNPEYRSPGRAIFVKTMVWVVVAVVLIMVTLVYYRSVTVHGPETALFVTGDRSLDGAKVVVTSLDARRRSWTVLLTRDNNWKTPVLLETGEYHVRVTHAGNEITAADFSVDPMLGKNLPLPSAVRVVGSETIGEAVVTLIEVLPATPPNPRPHPIKLSQKNGFHTIAYILPGTYQVTGTHDGRTVYSANLTIDRATVTRIDLANPPKSQIEAAEETSGEGK